MNWNTILSDKRFVNVSNTNNSYDKTDYDKIICSTLFRRLQDKAQVFPLDEDDYVRTRLTHSLEVSAIGKKLGEFVFDLLIKERKDDYLLSHYTKYEFADILLCAGLIHDIGNPPFGHFGEYAIREWFLKNLDTLYLGSKKVKDILTPWQIQDLYNFEGNAQSLRLLSRTPYLGNQNGFNLSYKVLAAIIKYPISSIDKLTSNPHRYKKFGYYYSEQELFNDLDRTMQLNGCRHPLSWLLEAADDISYRTSDIEDAIVKKVLTLQQIIDSFSNYLATHENTCQFKDEVAAHLTDLISIYKEQLLVHDTKPELTALQIWNQNVQDLMIRDASMSFIQHYDQIMSGCFSGDLFEGTVSGCIIDVIAQLSEQYIYTSPLKTRTELFGRRIILSLLDQFMPAALLYDTNEAASFIDHRTMDTVSGFYKCMYHSEAVGKSEQDKLYLRILLITDYISGMTDNYAKRLYQELFI